MGLTGGPLNELNGKMGISAPYKSVSVMQLIRVHKPKTKSELRELIRYHYKHRCNCGIISQGTVELFGQWLHASQIKYWGEYRYTLQECIQWEDDLFITQSLRGNTLELKAIKHLNMNMPDLSFMEPPVLIDENYRVDIIVQSDSNTIAGIQVKPTSYKHMRQSIIDFGIKSHQKWHYPVLYLYYNEQNQWSNLKTLVNDLKSL